MASERQIAANRQNARKSTGPRSATGKKRASRNAYRHGLSKPSWGAAFNRAVDDLARDIAGDAADPATLELAREVAEAKLELDRVRRCKIALIARMSAFGRLDVLPRFRSPLDEGAWILLHYCGAKLWKNRPKFAVDNLPPMPTEEPQRTAEAVRRVLPSLVRLQRYEMRAATRRDQAVRALSLRRYAENNKTSG
jgi:hypothetical protein